MSDRNPYVDGFVAELTAAAYSVALRHERRSMWLDLELDLWRALCDTVRRLEALPLAQESRLPSLDVRAR